MYYLRHLECAKRAENRYVFSNRLKVAVLTEGSRKSHGRSLNVIGPAMWWEIIQEFYWKFNSHYSGEKDLVRFYDVTAMNFMAYFLEHSVVSISNDEENWYIILTFWMFVCL